MCSFSPFQTNNVNKKRKFNFGVRFLCRLRFRREGHHTDRPMAPPNPPNSSSPISPISFPNVPIPKCHLCPHPAGRLGPGGPLGPPWDAKGAARALQTSANHKDFAMWPPGAGNPMNYCRLRARPGPSWGPGGPQRALQTTVIHRGFAMWSPSAETPMNYCVSESPFGPKRAPLGTLFGSKRVPKVPNGLSETQ